uniref:Uncharacterized protein n=1 Tax=Phocoena sinus TaxID=42100 RepID=A0A8C9KXR8_PHOSS
MACGPSRSTASGIFPDQGTNPCPLTLGESAFVKSSLVLCFVKGHFHEFQESTMGAAFLAQTVCLDDTTVKFEMWDTAGEEQYRSLAPMYYRRAQASIVRAKNWVTELQRQANPNIVIALSGNKADLANKTAVNFQEAHFCCLGVGRGLLCPLDINIVNALTIMYIQT